MDKYSTQWPANFLPKLFILVLSITFIVWFLASLPLEATKDSFIKSMFIPPSDILIEEPSTVPPIRPGVENLECHRLIANDTEYIKMAIKNRPTMRDDDGHTLGITCDDIRGRILPARNLANGYPIAFTKVVYTDYAFLEEQLAVTYAEENWYYFTLDKKAPVWFRRRFVALSMCLHNVLLSDDEWNTDSAGHFNSFAHLDCLKKLEEKKWNYVVLMQNHDLIVKTNDELATIFKTLNGTNDMQYNHCPGHVCIGSLERNLGRLNLCPRHLNATEAERCRAQNLTWGKGMMQMTLMKKTVSYILKELNLTPLLTQLNNVTYGTDEAVYQTLTINRVLQIPGGSIPYSCIKNRATDFISRTTIWMYGNDYCPSKHIRHMICVRGMEDIAELAAIPEILVNKVIPEFDYGIIACMGQLLYNRSRSITSNKLSMEYYSNLPMVRYNREKWKANFSDSEFDCYKKLG